MSTGTRRRWGELAGPLSGRLAAIIGVCRFFVLPAVFCITVAGFLAGGGWLWAGIVAYLAIVIGADTLVAEDRAVPDARARLVCETALYAAVPPVIVGVLMWAFYLGSGDVLGIGTIAGEIAGLDLAAARARTGLLELVGGALSLGVMFSTAGGVIAHELMHRIDRPRDVALARALLALSGFTNLVIEHVHGHHRNVGLPEDPTTAARGQGFWRYCVTSFIDTNRGAFAIERQRLARAGVSGWHWRNRALSWQLAPLGVLAFFAASAGAAGMIGITLTAVISVVIIQLFNYVGHYGLVRVASHPVAPRHSWSTFHAISTGYMLNLPRHANHHMNARRPYWQLPPADDAPVYPCPIGAAILLAMMPPLWHRFTAPLLFDWDQRLASPAERACLASMGQLATTNQTKMFAGHSNA